MPQHTLRYAPVLLSLALAAAAGCDRSSDTPTAPASPGFQTALTAEPRSARPEFLPGVCDGRSAFGVRVFISLRGRDAVLNGLRFQFIDVVGNRTLPEVIRLPSPSSAATSLPSASPLTLPGIAALPPLPGTGVMPFFARFGCGIVPEGTLVITGDVNGRTEEMKVTIADR